MPTAADYRAMAQRIAAQEFGDSPLAAIWLRMLEQESGGFDPNVVEGQRVSSAGAQGVGQFMPATAKGLGINPLDPAQALPASARYLKQQISYFGGDAVKGVAAYNAGAGTIDKAVKAGGEGWQRFIPAETQAYLRITQPGQQSAATQSSAWVSPVKGAQTQGFGKTQYAQTSGRYTTGSHDGVDYGAREGEPVFAPVSGTVVYAGPRNRAGQAVLDNTGYGNTVFIDDGTGAVHMVGHLSAVGVKVGDKVRAGTPVGGAGQTGNSDGVHVHYEVRQGGVNGTPVDPTPYIQGQSAAQPAAPGGAPVTTPTAPTTTQWDSYAAASKQRATLSQQAYDTALQRYNSLIAKPFDQLSETDQIWLTQANQTISILQRDAAQAADDWQKAEALRIEASQSGGVKPLTEAERLGYNRGVAQDARAAVKDYYDSVAAMAQAAFTNDINAQRFVYDVLVRNFDQTLQQHNAQMQGRQMRLEEYNSVVAAESMQQQAEAARFVQGLAAAKFINEANQTRALMALPAGQLHQSGWGPNDPMNQMLQSLGFNPVVIEAAQVPADWLDPVANMRQATQAQTEAGWGAPAFTTKPISDLAKEPMPAFTGQPLDASRFGISSDTAFKPPVAPDYAAIQAGYAQGTAGLPPSWLDLLPSALPDAQQQAANPNLVQAQPRPGFGQQIGNRVSGAAGAVNTVIEGLPGRTQQPATFPVREQLPESQGQMQGQSWFESLPQAMPGLSGMRVDPTTGDIVFRDGRRFKKPLTRPPTQGPSTPFPGESEPWAPLAQTG